MAELQRPEPAPQGVASSAVPPARSLALTRSEAQPPAREQPEPPVAQLPSVPEAPRPASPSEAQRLPAPGQA